MTEFLLALWLAGFVVFLWALISDVRRRDGLTAGEYASAAVVCALWPMVAFMAVLVVMLSLLLFKGDDPNG